MPPRKGFGLSLQLPPDSAAAPGQGDAGGAPPRVGAGGELLHQSLRVRVCACFVCTNRE